MAAPDEIVTHYFQALNDRDLEAAGSLWAASGVDRFVGQEDVIGPDGVRRYFAELFAAFPDFSIRVLELAAAGARVVARWSASGTFAGPGSFQGFEPNGAQIEIEGCDVLTIEGELIVHNDAYLDTGDIARQLGFLPPAGSVAEARLTQLANLRTRAAAWRHGGNAEPVADGVWVLRGGFPVFDAGIEGMVVAIRAAAARLGGIRRVVLGHADADHRGAAPGLGVPVYCHPAEREAAESPEHSRTYWDFSKLAPHGRLLLGRLIPVWDGGAVQIAGTLQEGDEVSGFRVIELPGHAPGLIALFRERDRLALVSDCFYTLDPQTGIKGRARVPPPAFNVSTPQAAESIRRLAGLSPSAAWAGHAEPVTGDVVGQLELAAAGSPA